VLLAAPGQLRRSASLSFMQDHEVHLCGSVGIKAGLLCATLGLLSAILLMTPRGTIEIVLKSEASFQFGLFVGLIALYVVAASGGKIAGRFACLKGNRIITNICVGVSLALCSLSVSVLAGSFVSFLVGKLGHAQDSSDLFLVIVGPLFWTLIFGGGPAMVLGMLYGILVGRGLTKLYPAT
jgi:hypothetical protein